MAKSISLSFDMNELFLVKDDDSLVSISLSGDGADISLDGSGGLEISQSTNPNIGPDGVMKNTVNALWTFDYDASQQKLFFIGITDILGGKSESFEFPLNGKVINVRLQGSSLWVTSS